MLVRLNRPAKCSGCMRQMNTGGMHERRLTCGVGRYCKNCVMGMRRPTLLSEWLKVRRWQDAYWAEAERRLRCW
jgi:late competence protein required for DNA uptake (superfamily II DNA/RNA helicase)